MKIRYGKSNKEGTTLVDVIMAVAIIAIMASGIVGALSYGFFTMSNVRENQRATQIMLETLETIRLYNWSQVNSNGFIPPTFSAVYDPQSSAGQQGLTYYGTIAKTNGLNVGASINTNMVQLDISLRWTNRNIPHFRTVRTFIAKDGIQNYVF
jgi:type II secretory pathway pseudopilin PulG